MILITAILCYIRPPYLTAEWGKKSNLTKQNQISNNQPLLNKIA